MGSPSAGLHSTGVLGLKCCRQARNLQPGSIPGHRAPGPSIFLPKSARNQQCSGSRRAQLDSEAVCSNEVAIQQAVTKPILDRVACTHRRTYCSIRTMTFQQSPGAPAPWASSERPSRRPSASTWAATLPDQGGRSKLFVRRGGVHTFRITGHQHCPRKAKKDPKQLKKAPKSLKKAPKRNRVSCHDVGW